MRRNRTLVLPWFLHNLTDRWWGMIKEGAAQPIPPRAEEMRAHNPVRRARGSTTREEKHKTRGRERQCRKKSRGACNHFVRVTIVIPPDVKLRRRTFCSWAEDPDPWSSLLTGLPIGEVPGLHLQLTCQPHSATSR